MTIAILTIVIVAGLLAAAFAWALCAAAKHADDQASRLTIDSSQPAVRTYPRARCKACGEVVAVRRARIVRIEPAILGVGRAASLAHKTKKDAAVVGERSQGGARELLALTWHGLVSLVVWVG